ncbi:MAG: cupin domain-containing protein [Synergistaceae bacterium]|nr:cupin domain-containing protein [Synergistaceae bacterium]
MFTFNKDVTATEPIAGFSRKILSYDENLMVVEGTFKKGTFVASHHHPHTQASYVSSGSIRAKVGGETRTLSKGDSILMGPDEPHEIEMLEDSVVIDVFTPMREDFVK